MWTFLKLVFKGIAFGVLVSVMAFLLLKWLAK